jgi:hypothetical protein
MNVRILLAVLAAALAVAAPAHADEACKMTQLPNPALSLAEMHKQAEARAKAWKPDAKFVSMSNTTLGLLKLDGAAASWHVIFHSEAAKSWVSIDTANGYFTCSANSGSAGRMADVKPEFFRDGAALYAIAKQHGEALLAQGYGVMIGTAAAPSTRHATWNINYHKDGAKDGKLLVIVDANTGKVEKVLK